MRPASPFLALACALLAAGPAVRSDEPPADFPTDLAAAQADAKATGVPVLVVVGKEVPPVLAEPQAALRVRWFLTVRAEPGSAAAKKLTAPADGAAVLLDPRGPVAAKLPGGFTAAQLIAAADPVAAKLRAGLAAKVKADGPADGRKAAVATLARLGATPAELVPLLAAKPEAVRAAVADAVRAAPPDAAALALLDALAGPDPAFRATCHALLAEVVELPGLPPAKFWQEGSAKDRAAARDKGRAAAVAALCPVNGPLLAFCEANLGKQVGNGECSVMVVEGLKAATGRPWRTVGRVYDWGRRLAPGEPLLPGDVVQFEGAKLSSGVSLPHHTQVVRKVFGPGRYEALEQNMNGRKTVGPSPIVLDLAKLTAGTADVFRPLPAGKK